MTSYFCYREANSLAELEALLRLRYSVYRNSRLAGFCPENPWGLDLDAYDCRARHYGLFYCEAGKQRPVGYMRVIQEGETDAASWVRRIAILQSPELFEKVCWDPKQPFPIMNYFAGASQIIGNLIKEAHQKGKRFCEGSRLIILPEFASARIGIHLIESAIAICLFKEGFQHAMMGCCETHSLIYRRLCFDDIPGLDKQVLQNLLPDVNAHLFLLSLSVFQKQARPDLRQRIDKMAKTFGKHQCICFYLGLPGQYAPPKASDHAKIVVDRNSGYVRANASI